MGDREQQQDEGFESGLWKYLLRDSSLNKTILDPTAPLHWPQWSCPAQTDSTGAREAGVILLQTLGRL